MTHPEQKIQTAIVVAMRRKFDAFIFHVPNGGARTKLEALHFKDAGTSAGVPDLIALDARGGALFIEVKAKIQVRERAVAPADRLHSLSDSQKIVVPDLRRRGFTVVVVDNVDDALAAGIEFGLEPKRSAVRSPLEAHTGF